MNKIEIPFSKTKIILAIAGSILFVVLGFYLYGTIAEQQVRFNPLLVKTAGIAAILFFSITGYFAIKKFFSKKPGLIIDETGIINNTGPDSIGLIEWSDITEIKSGQVRSTRFVHVFINEPNKILEKVRGMERKMMIMSMKMCGTPISITSTTLKSNFDDLEKLLKSKLNEYRDRNV